MVDAVTGIQPTGIFHIGNYLGMLEPAVNLSLGNEIAVFMADLHALTTHDTHDSLRHNAVLGTASLLACGFDINNGFIFIQSEVYMHYELFWILSCLVHYGPLSRMTQFKSKSDSLGGATLGLFAYPVLMAADILLYNPKFVPIGDDQQQHLELTRNLASAFNAKYGNILKMPEPAFSGKMTRVMSLQDGTKKMSKSDISELSRINLNDSNETIVRKIQRAKTDAVNSLSDNIEQRPEVSNLLGIFTAISGVSTAQLIKEYDGRGFAIFKQALADAMVAKLEPIRKKIDTLMADQYILLINLQKGRDKARAIAEVNMMKIKNAIGLISS